MEYKIPHYFEDFQCIAGACKDTCCAGWAIMIDEETLEKYKTAEGAFGNRLHNSIDWKEGCFCQHNKRCAFLNEDNLCDIYIEAGEHMLCDTCKDYPRHMEEFEGVREGSLSLSCIEAAKLILGCEKPVEFYSFEDDVEDEEFEDFDFLLFTKLMDVREAMIACMQNREIDILMRMGMVLELAQKMQDAIDENELFKIDELLETFGNMDYLLAFQKHVYEDELGGNEFCSDMRKMFRVFQKMEVLKEDWPDYVKHAEKVLYGQGRSEYLKNRQQFHEQVALKSANHVQWEIWLEQLMVYFIFVYFCGAVYDDYALGKIQTGVVSTLLIQELLMAAWIEKGQISFEDVVEVAHRVSRELEHSDLNIIRMEKICEKSALFETNHLISIILHCTM